MKTRPAILLLCALCCCPALRLQAQVNLVPNPSFEDTVSCPSNYGDINKAVGWQSLCASPDYYHSCGLSGFTGVPNNAGGYQQPASGNAYAGFLSYIGSWANGREFVAHNLVSPLIVGTKYFVSFKVSLSLGLLVPSNYASNKMGAMFTMATYTCQTLITNNPPVYSDSVVMDSAGWTRIFGSIIADSAYNYIVIGNFFDDANTDTVMIYNDPQDNAYYYLDDVCVSTDSAFTYNYVYTGVEENNSVNNIILFPNPVKDILTVKNFSGEPLDIEAYNLLGKLLFRHEKKTGKSFQIDLSSTSPGIFFVKVQSQKQTSTYKLLKLQP